jgi:alpha,alpha-trehalase
MCSLLHGKTHGELPEMSGPVLVLEGYSAFLFDLDGVLTATARIHAAAWKRTFDEYLEERSSRTGEDFSPFDEESDYKHYVDGKLRYEGVDAFLRSRGIELPWGTPSDAPAVETVCGIGNRKNLMVKEAIESEGVEVFESSVRLVRELREAGMKTAVVSASRNCLAVLRKAGIEELFQVRVDGVVAAEEGLAGKPAPDTFLKAAALLGVAPSRAVVVEDAVSGVQAGRNGGGGLVVGVDRRGDPGLLRENGAHLVVSDLGELEVRARRRWKGDRKGAADSPQACLPERRVAPRGKEVRSGVPGPERDSLLPRQRLPRYARSL